tara:strand:+ start:1109 stop:1753 length:645 start_codon:yes stop_codon:yes gene_type:complete
MGIFSRLIACLLFLILIPALLFVALISFVNQGSPIIFKQERVGFKLKKFMIYKFRTMMTNNGPSITVTNDKRVTRWGKFLRYLKLDELPQIINIIKGDMRFIGPRPELPEFVETKSFSFLNKVPPGLSDYSSIIFRNESLVLNKIGGPDPYEKLLSYKIQLAKFYSKRKSFIEDFILVLITIIAIVFPSFTSRKLVLPFIIRKIPEFKKIDHLL